MSLVLSESLIKKTKVDHICCICDKPIEKGETCYRQVNIYEGDFCCVYWHNSCSSTHQWDDYD
jgi:hypothetical protein